MILLHFRKSLILGLPTVVCMDIVNIGNLSLNCNTPRNQILKLAGILRTSDAIVTYKPNYDS